MKSNVPLVHENSYPSHVSLSRPLTSQRVQREIRAWLIAYLKRKENSLPVGRGTELPPAIGGPNYAFRESRRDTRLQERLYSQIDTRDHLMMRGLSTLLRSIMIGQHFQFTEEAIHAVFIAMDASFSLIRRRLSNRGQKNVSSVDAAKYLAAVFYEEIIEMRYFEEFYDNRIMSIHPESRFGTFAHPPLMVDDFYHLRDSMIGIYAYFNSGQVSNEIVEFAVSQNRLADYRLYGHMIRLRYVRKAKFGLQKIRQSSPLYSTGFER